MNWRRPWAQSSRLPDDFNVDAWRNDVTADEIEDQAIALAIDAYEEMEDEISSSLTPQASESTNGASPNGQAINGEATNGVQPDAESNT